MGGPSGASEPPEARRLRMRQLQDIAQLDEQENARVRRIMQAGRGMRAFKGSPDMRLRRGNLAGGMPASLPPGYNAQRAAEPSNGALAKARIWTGPPKGVLASARVAGVGSRKGGQRLIRRYGA